ncbi:hypothetical protein MMC25_001056 [Agyrium rufum]|nr:hypothetical protein [Agyrium rufum]
MEHLSSQYVLPSAFEPLRSLMSQEQAICKEYEDIFVALHKMYHKGARSSQAQDSATISPHLSLAPIESQVTHGQTRDSLPFVSENVSTLYDLPENQESRSIRASRAQTNPTQISGGISSLEIPSSVGLPNPVINHRMTLMFNRAVMSNRKVRKLIKKQLAALHEALDVTLTDIPATVSNAHFWDDDLPLFNISGNGWEEHKSELMARTTNRAKVVRLTADLNKANKARLRCGAWFQRFRETSATGFQWKIPTGEDCKFRNLQIYGEDSMRSWRFEGIVTVLFPRIAPVDMGYDTRKGLSWETKEEEGQPHDLFTDDLDTK